MRSNPERKHPFLRSLLSTFLAVALMGEATHTEEHQNPHTNRRERIEEVRQRATDVQHSSRARRSICGVGHCRISRRTSSIALANC